MLLKIKKSNEVAAKERQQQYSLASFKGNQTESFQLINGETASHTPEGFKFGTFTIETEWDNRGGGMVYNGYSLGKFRLATDSTREEFIAALKASGMYQ